MSMLSKALGKVGGSLVRAGVGVMPGGALVAGALGALAPVKRRTGGGPGDALGKVVDIAGRVSTLGRIGSSLYDQYGRGALNSAMGCPKGYHLAKNGSGKCVRNRRMNPANGRAIGRATRRLKAAEKMFRRVLSVEGKHAGKIKPKARKR